MESGRLEDGCILWKSFGADSWLLTQWTVELKETKNKSPKSFKEKHMKLMLNLTTMFISLMARTYRIVPRSNFAILINKRYYSIGGNSKTDFFTIVSMTAQSYIPK